MQILEVKFFFIKFEENYKNKVKMEKDLVRVQDMMAGLIEQQVELSEVMKRFRRLFLGGGLENMLEKFEKGEINQRFG